MIFLENNFNSSLFFKKLKKKKNTILDYGCGTGIWKCNELGGGGNKIYLYDKNKLALKHSKNKYYSHKNYIIISSLKEIKNLKLDVILLNSVIQYISKNNLEKLLLSFDKLLKKNYKIIISDIPIFNRLVEFCFIFFLAPKRLLGVLFIFINFNSYIKKNKFYLNNLNFEFLEKHFKFKKIKNFNNFKLRYGLVLEKKLKIFQK